MHDLIYISNFSGVKGSGKGPLPLKRRILRLLREFGMLKCPIISRKMIVRGIGARNVFFFNFQFSVDNYANNKKYCKTFNKFNILNFGIK